MRNFSQRANNNYTMVQAALAKEVLAEIPEQVTGYMKLNSILPRPRRHATAPPAL